jgi:hypothetical protein
MKMLGRMKLGGKLGAICDDLTDPSLMGCPMPGGGRPEKSARLRSWR